MHQLNKLSFPLKASERKRFANILNVLRTKVERVYKVVRLKIKIGRKFCDISGLRIFNPRSGRYVIVISTFRSINPCMRRMCETLFWQAAHILYERNRPRYLICDLVNELWQTLGNDELRMLAKFIPPSTISLSNINILRTAKLG